MMALGEKTASFMPLSISSNILFTQQQYLFYDTCDSGNEKINLMSGIFSFFIGIHHILF